MKPKSTLRSYLLLIGSSLLTISSASAQLYWDSNGNTAGFGNTVGTWGTSAFWNDNSSGGAPSVAFTATTTSSDTVNFGTATLNYGTSNVGVAAGGVTAAGIVMGAGQTTNITLGTAGNPITIHGGGITKNVGSGTLTISNSSTVNLGAAQTWTNNSTNAIDLRVPLDNGGNLLTIDGNGTTSVKYSLISGAGGLTKDGSGFLEIGGQYSAPVHTYTGPTIINGGTVRWENATLPSGNITINNGVFEKYWQGSITRTLGSNPGEIQILGGNSGLGFGSTGSTITFNNDATFEVVWGSAFFNPSTFVFGSLNTGSATWNNKLDLNGTTRTFGGTAPLTMSGVIRTSAGTAGLTKTGSGTLSLTATNNTYNGATTINGGILDATTFAAGGSNSSIGNTPVAASNLILDGGTLRHNAANVATTNRLFSVGTNGGGIDSSASTASNTLSFTNTGAMDFNSQLGTRTLTLGGSNTGNNTMALLIGNDGSGNATSLNKTGAGLWILSNSSNSYTGPTTLTGGTLSVGAAGNLGGASSNLVFDGGTLQITGTGLTSLSGLGRTVVLNSGKTVGLDIADASNIFTADQILNQGTGGLTKAGAGTLVLNQANTYTGVTTISAGTLRLDTGGAILGSVINNGVFLVNKTGTLTSGTDFPANIGGSGSFAIGAGASLTISTATGLSFNALNTTGGGSFTLSGVTTPTFGGLVGTTGNLSSSFTSGYNGVTNLTLNTPTGTTSTYGGVINDGAAGMSVTKIGGGTQILTGDNTYTGTTYLNGGTLTIGSGSTIGKLSGTTGLTFNGGTLQFNRSGITDIAAINDSAPITVNSSSTFGATSADAGNANANETIGAVTLNAGQMNFNWTNGGSSGTQMILTSLSRSGTASANFNSGFATNNSRWKVTGAGTTTAGQIVGPWYTTGGNNAGFASTDYAVYSSDFIAPAAIAGSAETGWTTAANAYTNALAAQTLTGTRTITALRNTGATATLTLASGFNLETYGLLNGVSTLFTVAPGTGGVLTTPTGGGNLYLNAGAGAITVSAPINNNGGNVTLVKNGSNTLTLSSTTSDYSGGTVLNAGTVSFTADTNFGAAGTGITFNGNAILSSPSNADTSGVIDLGSRSVTLNNGAVATLTGTSRLNLTIGGAVTGSGGVTFQQGGFWTKARLNSTSNTFSGAITVTSAGDDGNTVFSINSIADGAGYGAIILNNTSADGDNIGLDYGTGGASGAGGGGATAALVLDNRQIVVATNTNNVFNNSSNQAVTINTDLGFSGTGARSMKFGINARAGSGISTFAGKLTDNVGGVFSPTFAGGIWVLSNSANTYTGTTTVSAGTLRFANGALGSVGAINASGGTLQWSSGNTQDISSRLTMTAATTTTLNTNGNNVTFANAIGGSTTGALTKAGAGTLLLSGTNTYTGLTTVNDGTLGGNCTIGGAVTVNAAGSLAPGASAGTLAITGALTLTNQVNGGTGKLKFELGSIASSDKITVGGNLTIGTALLGFSDFEFSTLPGLQDGTYTLLTYGGTLSGTLAPSGQLSGPIGSGTGTLQLNTTTKTLELVVTDTGGGGSPEIAVEQPAATDITNGGSKGFGTVTLGSNTSLTFTIRNTGTDVLNLTGSPLVAVSGANAADFTVTATPTTPVTSGGGTTTFTVQFAPGGAGARSALLTIANNDSDEGTFTINVNGTGQTQYDAWSGGAAFDADANGDGVKNGLAFLLGAANPSASALGLLPTVTQSGGNLTLTFNCRNAASRGSASLSVEHSSNLGISDPWTAVAVPETSGGPTSGVTFTVAPGSPTNSVTATISSSEAASGKLFGRLKANP